MQTKTTAIPSKSATAGSLGLFFWFNLLQHFMSIRSALKPSTPKNVKMK